MLADPQTVTIATVAHPMAAVSRSGEASKYSEADPGYDLHISHQEGNRRRRMVRLNHTKIAADPLTAQNATIGASVYLVIDEPLWGYTDTELGDVVAGFVAYLTTATVAKVLGGES